VDDRSNYDAAMIGRLSALPLLVAVGAVLLAGCGGKSSAGTTTVSTSPSVASGNTAPTNGNTAPTNGKTAPTPTPQQEVVLCQHAVESMRTLPLASKVRLKSSCEKVGTGQAGKQQVAREVCLELASQLASPEGRARALKLCSAP
jgi:hypothetical protein